MGLGQRLEQSASKTVISTDSAQLENYDNLSLSVEYFGWLNFLNELISHEIRKKAPNTYSIQMLSDIAGHIASSNNIHDIYKEAKGAKNY